MTASGNRTSPQVGRTLSTITDSHCHEHETGIQCLTDITLPTLNSERVASFTWQKAHDFENRVRALYRDSRDCCFFFLTLTVPGTASGVAPMFDLEAKTAVTSFLSKLRRRLSWRKSARYVGAFERVSDSKPLHCHLLLEVPKVYVNALQPHVVQEVWRATLIDLSRNFSVNFFESLDGVSWLSDSTKPHIFCEQARSPISVGRYCLKLLNHVTKSEHKLPLSLENGRLSAPKQWAFASRGLRKLAAKEAFRGHFEIESIEALEKFVEQELAPVVKTFAKRDAWREHRNEKKLLIGRRTLIDPVRFDQLRRELKRLHKLKLRNAFVTPTVRRYRNVCVIQLDLSGRLCCYLRVEDNRR